MYYAVLGYKSSTIDIFNHKSGQWTLVRGLFYGFRSTFAIAYKGIIYATTSSYHGRLVAFDPASLKH